MAVSVVVPAIGQGTLESPYMKWVRQLGDASFARRELAAKELIGAGILAQPALMHGLEFDDLEVRLRAHRILVQIMQDDFESRIMAFLNDTSPDAAHNLPGWDAFHDQIEDSRPARALYADMLRAETGLIVAFDRGEETIEQMCIERMQTVRNSRTAVGGLRAPIPAPTLATILFIAAQLHHRSAPDPGVRATNSLTNLIYSVLVHSGTQQMVLSDSHSQLLKRLLLTWVEGIGRSEEPYGLAYALQLVLRYDIEQQGPEIARKVLADPGNTISSVPYAAIVLARFGKPEEVDLLKPHLDATQVFHTWSNVQLKKEPIRIQVRDAVLAMTIVMHKQDPADFGFKLLQPDEHTIYHIYTMGFLDDAERQAAFAKWKAYREAAARIGGGRTSSDQHAGESNTPKSDDASVEGAPGDGEQ